MIGILRSCKDSKDRQERPYYKTGKSASETFTLGFCDVIGIISGWHDVAAADVYNRSPDLPVDRTLSHFRISQHTSGSTQKQVKSLFQSQRFLILPSANTV